MNPQGKIAGKGGWIVAIFIAILMLRISSYFTMTDSLAIARVIKLGTRLMLTGFCTLWWFSLKTKVGAPAIKGNNFMSLGFYMAYLLLGIFSLLWTSSVSTSLLQLSMTIESLFFVFIFYQLWLYKSNELEGLNLRLSRLLSVSITLISIVFIAGIYIAPDMFYRGTHGGEVSRLGGFIINPNELGMLLVIGMAMGIYELFLKNKAKFYWWAIPLMAYGLIQTGSRSSLIAFGLVLFLYIALYKKVVIKFAMAGLAVLSIPYLVQKVIIKMGDIGEVMSMTGRIPFWQDLVTHGFTKEPILGYGFMRISYHDKFESIQTYAASMTHNTFIQVLLNLGLVGFAIVSIQMALLAYAILKWKDWKMQLMACSLLIPLIINSLTEFGIFGESNYGIMFYQMVIMMFVFYIASNKNKILTTSA